MREGGRGKGGREERGGGEGGREGWDGGRVGGREGGTDRRTEGGTEGGREVGREGGREGGVQAASPVWVFYIDGAQNNMMRTDARGLQKKFCKIKQNCCRCRQAFPIS